MSLLIFSNISTEYFDLHQFTGGQKNKEKEKHSSWIDLLM